MRLRLKGKTLDLCEGEPLIMGIVNIGSDSVADPLSLDSLEAQVEFAMRQSDAGAHIIDIGVQSGRTDTPVLAEEQEIERLVPLVRALAERELIVSVDTWRAGVAEAAIEVTARAPPVIANRAANRARPRRRLPARSGPRHESIRAWC